MMDYEVGGRLVGSMSPSHLLFLAENLVLHSGSATWWLDVALPLTVLAQAFFLHSGSATNKDSYSTFTGYFHPLVALPHLEMKHL